MLWRALRLVIDTGLHGGNMTRDQALQLFAEYLWDVSDVPEKEVSRYQSTPGQATSYMIGRQAIWKIRNATESKLGSKFNLKDFHYHILRQGVGPLPYIERYMKRYVNCVLEQAPSAQTCAEVIGTAQKDNLFRRGKQRAIRANWSAARSTKRMRDVVSSWNEDDMQTNVLMF